MIANADCVGCGGAASISAWTVCGSDLGVSYTLPVGVELLLVEHPLAELSLPGLQVGTGLASGLVVGNEAIDFGRQIQA
ncbi:hypothetical protein VI26_18020 [Chromobacterium sp. LK1]|nr:hypothetical protein VI26_18020 [Chromobacterium sp. LK1]